MKTAYDMRISDWSSDVCSSDLPDCAADLHFADFHPRFDYHAIAMPGRKLAGAAHHFEVSGRMTGRIRIGAHELTIEALGYRDRSWARRDWSTSRGTRWWPCVFGPDLTKIGRAHV